MSWVSYTVKRGVISAGVLLAASIIIFSIVRLVPGDPALIILGQYAEEGAAEALRERLGLNVPVWRQYFEWVISLLTLDWGRSLTSDNAVLELMIARYPRSLQLAIFSLVIAMLVAFPLGIFAASQRGGRLDQAAIFFSQLGISMPSFWLGILFILLFANYLDLLPPSGHAPLLVDPVMNIKHLILPALSLGVINAAVFTRYLRSEMLEEMGKDYVQTAKAYGHSRRRIILKYVLRNAMIPTVTVIGIQFGFLIGGVVIIEEVFSYPGVGRLILTGLLQRDYPVIQLGLLVLAATFVITNFIVDMIYGLLNPKIRY